MYPYNFIPYQPTMAPQANQIIKVNGNNGAQAYQMSANSSALLLDETTNRVFLVQTDGAGYKSIIPYKLVPETPPKTLELEELIARIEKIEGAIENGKYNIRNGSTPEQNKRSSEKS